MTTDQLSRLRQQFSRYVSEFAEDGELHPMQQLKLDHSWRVAANCRQIAREISLEDNLVLLAEVAGILHDVARFEQYRRFQTFADWRSFNHGEFGFALLGEFGWLESFPAAEREIVLTAVRCHNAKEIQESIHGDALCILNILRDADKADILKVMAETVRTRSFESFPELLLHIDPAGPLNPGLVRAIREQGKAGHELLHSLVDVQLLATAWMLDINYTPTLEIILSHHILDDLRANLPDTLDVREILCQIDRVVSQRIENRSAVSG